MPNHRRPLTPHDDLYTAFWDAIDAGDFDRAREAAEQIKKIASHVKPLRGAHA